MIYSLHDEHVGVLLAEAVYHVTHVRIEELNRDMQEIPETERPPAHATPGQQTTRG